MNTKALVYLVAGARPNFMKIAPIIRSLQERDQEFEFSLIHTGQHYDYLMNEVFFAELAIPEPAHFLNVGSGSHARQTADIMLGFETICVARKPDIVLVVGDVNSTLACTIVAKKLGIQVAHVEAGLRSGDRSMPEEINRIITDSVSDLFFVTEESAYQNLLAEGQDRAKLHLVGNVMIDNLKYQNARLDQEGLNRATILLADIPQEDYGVVTLHRASNVDDRETLSGIVAALDEISQRLPLLFPVHPRTRQRMEEFGLVFHQRVVLVPPLSYMDFLAVWRGARVVLTDSGGLQEETTALGVPCLTLRDNTERPVTLSEGSNQLVGTDPARIVAALEGVLQAGPGNTRVPALWDGEASRRIVDVLATAGLPVATNRPRC